MYTTGREALEDLKRGNEAFLNGKELSSRTPEAIESLIAIGQKNTAAVLGCADSRVKPSEIFGDCSTFSVRIAGNVPNQEVMESLIYDVEANGTQLVAVLGHTNCGAVQSVIKDPLTTGEKFPKIYDHIAPSVAEARKSCCEHNLELGAINENVKRTLEFVVEQFRIRSITRKGLLFVGGVVHLEEGGRVCWFENQAVDF